MRGNVRQIIIYAIYLIGKNVFNYGGKRSEQRKHRPQNHDIPVTSRSFESYITYKYIVTAHAVLISLYIREVTHVIFVLGCVLDQAE